VSLSLILRIKLIISEFRRFRQPYLCSSVDGNAIVDNSLGSIEDFAAAINKRDDSVLGGIDPETFRPRFLRYRMKASCLADLPAKLKEIYDLATSQVSVSK
jgi:hypothetical protein